jgi:hypothetical protein
MSSYSHLTIAVRITLLESGFDLWFFAGMGDPHNIWIAREVELSLPLWYPTRKLVSADVRSIFRCAWVLIPVTVFRPQPSPVLRLGRKTVRLRVRDRCALHCAGQHSFCWPSSARGGLVPYWPVTRTPQAIDSRGLEWGRSQLYPPRHCSILRRASSSNTNTRAHVPSTLRSHTGVFCLSPQKGSIHRGNN